MFWVLPHAASGLLVGIYAKVKNFNLSFKQISIISIISALLVTALNTLALYIDSKMFGYYSSTLVFGSLLVKVITGIFLALIYASVLPKLIAFLRKQLKK